MTRLLMTVLAVGLWTAVTAYGAIDGWWLKPIAPKGDTRAFMDAAIAMSNAQSRGNVALVLMHNGEVYDEHFVRSVDRIDRNTRFPLASMSKWFTGYAVMRLVQDGKTDCDISQTVAIADWAIRQQSRHRTQIVIAHCRPDGWFGLWRLRTHRIVAVRKSVTAQSTSLIRHRCGDRSGT